VADTMNDAMAGLNIDPSMSSTSMRGSGFTGKVTSAFSGVNQSITSMIAGLSTAAGLTKKMKEDAKEIARNLRGITNGVGGNSVHNFGNIGQSNSMNLGLAGFSGGGGANNGLAAGINGGGTPGMGTFGGSKFAAVAGGVARLGLIGAGTAYAMLPQMNDQLARNRMLFNASLASGASPGAVGRAAINATSGLATSSLDAYQMAATLGSYGYNPTSAGGRMMMTSAAQFGMLTGTSPTAMAQTFASQMTNPQMGNRLMLLGMNALDKNGDPKDPKVLADQLYSRLGFAGLSQDKVLKDLRPGFNGARNLEHFIPDPNLRATVQTYIEARAKNGGKPVNMSGAGLNALGGGVLSTQLAQGAYNTAQSNKIEAFNGSMSSGYVSGLNTATSVSNAMTDNADLFQTLGTAKGFVDAFIGSSEGQAGITGATAALKLFIGALSGATAASALSGVGGGVGGGGLFGGAGRGGMLRGLVSKMPGLLKMGVGAGSLASFATGGSGMAVLGRGLAAAGTFEGLNQVENLANNYLGADKDSSNWRKGSASFFRFLADIGKTTAAGAVAGGPVGAVLGSILGIGQGAKNWSQSGWDYGTKGNNANLLGFTTPMGDGASTSENSGSGSGTSQSHGVTGSDIASFARKYVGVPYKDTGPKANPDNGWGCSQFTAWVFKQYGITLPAYCPSQFQKGTAVSKGDVQAGDLVFFYYPNSRYKHRPNHVGIAIDKKSMVHAASPSKGTIIGPIDWKHFVGARRVYTHGQVNSSNNATSIGTGSKVASNGIGFQALELSSLMTSNEGVHGSISSVLELLNASTGGTSAPNAVASTTAAAAAGGDVTTTADTTTYGNGLMGMLTGAGFNGQGLRMAWSIAMRESHGNPAARSPKSGTYPNGSYDAGLFQYNSKTFKGRHLDTSKLYDGNYQAKYTYNRTHNMTTGLVSWGLTAQGGLDNTYYTGWSAQHQQDWIMKPFKKYYDQFPSAAHKAGIPGYSQGAWSISQDQTARIHAGEMILPASVAQTVRDSVGSAYAGQSGGASGGVNITVVLQGASDADAVRFGRKVRAVIAGEANISSIGAS